MEFFFPSVIRLLIQLPIKIICLNKVFTTEKIENNDEQGKGKCRF